MCTVWLFAVVISESPELLCKFADALTQTQDTAELKQLVTPEKARAHAASKVGCGA